MLASIRILHAGLEATELRELLILARAGSLRRVIQSEVLVDDARLVLADLRLLILNLSRDFIVVQVDLGRVSIGSG